MRHTLSYVVRLLILVGLFSPVNSASLCDQTFTIHGKTKGENSLLFWEVFRGGECYHWYGYALVLGDSVTPVLTFNPEGQTWVARLLADLPTEEAVRIAPTEGVYRIDDSISVQPPPEDTTFVSKFSGLISGGAYGNASEWHRMCSSNCNDYPVVHGCGADVVYSYKGGVYKSYSFKEVLYYPESRYVVVITDQPQTAVGLDTMHGLLVLKLELGLE